MAQEPHQEIQEKWASAKELDQDQLGDERHRPPKI
jgi:hypothetical protein